ncbi:MAG: class I SAM-dependent methyltransferase [Pseudomonadota bacterium]
MPGTEKAWDCACGTGQSALGLSRYFKEVIATDASENQISNAETKPGITYQVATAEKSFINDGEIELVTVAQALHWFDIELFFEEANRVLMHNGILAVWSYNLLKINETVDGLIDHLYHQILRQYWPAERKMVENGYRDITFPFETVSSPSFVMQGKWDLYQLVGYLETWSAIKRYMKNRNSDEVAKIFEKITAAWGAPGMKQIVTWPLSVVIKKKVHQQ